MTMEKIRHYFFVLRSTSWAFLTYVLWYFKAYSSKDKASNISKVIHINTDDQSGGAAKIARELCELQRNNGIDSQLLVHTKKLTEHYSSQLQQSNSRKQHFLSFAQKRLGWQDFFHLSSLAIAKHPLVASADLVHLHNVHGDYFSYLALPSLSHVKHVVWSLHDMHPITGHCSYSLACSKWESQCGNCPDLTIYPALKKDTTKFIHHTKKISYGKSKLHVVALSNWMLKQLQTSILNDQALHLIYNGIDTSVFYPRKKEVVREQLGLPLDKKIILFSANLGTANPFKGSDYLIKLVADYSNENDYLFVAIGNNTDEESSNPNLKTVPYIKSADTMAEYYAAADLYLYPSLADNCPLVVLEAMGCGIPVLAFDTGGTAELVLHEKTGYIASYKNYDDLKNGFEWLFSNNERLTTLSEKASERVKELFTLEIMHENYMNLYRTIIQNDKV